ncbi:MAG: hypothetical protein AAF404_16820, partial [Pseudomonadota bacterium]
AVRNVSTDLSVDLIAERALSCSSDVHDVSNLNAIEGINQVELKSPHELTIEYDYQQFPDTDIKVLQWLAKHDLRYRQVLKGRSLEDQVFS